MATLTRNQSLENLNPAHESSQRHSSLTVAIFNLFSTICGGGVLSLPLAFSVAGIIPSTIILLIAAYINEFGLYILCVCARRIGGKTYMDVTRAAYGIKLEIITSLVLVTELVFSLIGYMILVKDIWTPCAILLCPGLNSYILQTLGDEATSEQVTNHAGRFVLLFSLCVISPLLMQEDLYALRHACYIGFCSLLLLISALIVTAYEKNVISNPEMIKEIKWFSWNLSDWIFAFPIIGLSFLCSYNVLSIQTALVNPTRERIRCVLTSATVICFCCFWVVGVSGYLSAYSKTQGNIFLNFPLSNKIMIFGRLGYGVTIVLALPVIIVPCREAALALPNQIAQLIEEYQLSSKYLSHPVDEETPLVINTAMNNPVLYTMTPPQVRESIVSPHVMMRTNSIPKKKHKFVHYAVTIIIVSLGYIGAIALPGVAVVWSIIGSFFSIMLAFTFPAFSYLRIRYHKGFTEKIIGSWILFVFSLVATCVCTSQTINNL